MASGDSIVRVGQIGYGYWGPNVLRNMIAVPGAKVTCVAETDAKRGADAARVAGGARVVTDYRELVTAPDVDAVVVTAPAAVHYEMALAALKADKHVLVEKPLALRGAECAELVELAAARKRVLMVGHTFLYSSPVQYLKKMISEGELGKVLYLYGQRLNLGRVRSDVNAMWNFAPHDVSIIFHLLGEQPVEVSARGFAYIQNGIPDVVFMNIVYADGRAAHIHISWLDPLKVRRMTVVGDRKMVVYDDTSADAKITIYDRGFDKIPTSQSPRDFADFAEFQLRMRSGDVVIPSVDFKEPLRLECAHFVSCVAEGKTPITDGVHGMNVTKLLEAAQLSLDNGGRPQPIR
jgi:predicted dehydrogenase